MCKHRPSNLSPVQIVRFFADLYRFQHFETIFLEIFVASPANERMNRQDLFLSKSINRPTLNSVLGTVSHISYFIRCWKNLKNTSKAKSYLLFTKHNKLKISFYYL